jgi:hypothetical protein
MMRPFEPGENLPEWLAQLDAERAAFEAGEGLSQSKLAIRREIVAGLPRCMTAAEEHSNRRYAEKRHEFVEARERPAREAQETERQAEAILELIDQRISPVFEDYDGDPRGALSQIIADERLARGAEVEEEITRALAALTKKIEPQFAEVERRVLSSAGKLPMVKTWTQDAVAYEGELFSDQRSLWQAQVTTGQAPGGSHWTCVARSADNVAFPLPNLRAPDFGDETNALRAEFAAAFEKASGGWTGSPTPTCCSSRARHRRPAIVSSTR